MNIGVILLVYLLKIMQNLKNKTNLYVLIHQILHIILHTHIEEVKQGQENIFIFPCSKQNGGNCSPSMSLEKNLRLKKKTNLKT